MKGERMKNLVNYVAFDLEFNTVANQSHILQVSAVKFENNQEVDTFDSYVYSSVPIQSFINGLTGITAEKIETAPPLNEVLDKFEHFIENFDLIGYNALKSDLPLLSENGLDLTSRYALDLYDEAFKRRSTDLNGIANLKLQSVANFLKITGKGHNSLEDARMTALVYEAFLENDRNRELLLQQKEAVNNPFGNLNLSDFLTED